MPLEKQHDKKHNTIVGDCGAISSFLLPSRRTMRCYSRCVHSCATAPGEHFPTMADHPPLLASSSLGFASVLRSHFSACKLERFMPVRLLLRNLFFRYLHSPLARLSPLGNSWRLHGLLSFCWGLVVCLVGFHGTVLNARVFFLYNYLVCWHQFTCIGLFPVVRGWDNKHAFL